MRGIIHTYEMKLISDLKKFWCRYGFASIFSSSFWLLSRPLCGFFFPFSDDCAKTDNALLWWPKKKKQTVFPPKNIFQVLRAHQIKAITLTWIMYFPSEPLAQPFMDLKWVLINTLTVPVPSHDICGMEFKLIDSQSSSMGPLSSSDGRGLDGEVLILIPKRIALYLWSSPLSHRFRGQA